MPNTDPTFALRNLPAIDELLNTSTARDLREEVGSLRLAELARDAVESLRNEIRHSKFNSDYSRSNLLEQLEKRIGDRWLEEKR